MLVIVLDANMVWHVGNRREEAVATPFSSARLTAPERQKL
jgi:hypothetical protein